MIEVKVKEAQLIAAAEAGMDEFIQVFVDAIYEAIGGQLTAETMAQLNSDQITLLGYHALRDEVMDGGFVQLIHNGWGAFFFRNPFDKAVRSWGMQELCSIIRRGHKLYDKYHRELEADCTDEEFMALFEQFAEFDEIDDRFVECEEAFTDSVAHYVDEHLDRFCTVVKQDE